MLKKTFSIFLILFILLTCISCKNKEEIKEEEFFTYYYDFSYYGFSNPNNINLKASNLDTLMDSINNKKTCIFTISSSTCLSCKNEVEILNDIALKRGFIVYLIDPYSHIYPIFDDEEEYNKLLKLLEPYLESKDDFKIPILFVINNGNIISCMVGHDNVDDDLLYETINNILSKSSIY